MKHDQKIDLIHEVQRLDDEAQSTRLMITKYDLDDKAKVKAVAFLINTN